MHLRGEASKEAVSPIAIVGAALRFPGADDPEAFHELTVTGRRMFQDIAHIAAKLGIAHPDGDASDALPHAALLDDEVIPALDQAAGAPTPSGPAVADKPATNKPATNKPADTPANDKPANDRAAARYQLAAETAVDALADVPHAGRPAEPGRTGVIIADTTEPGVADWVRTRLGLADPGIGPAANAHTCSLRAIADACDRLNSGQLDLVLAGGVSMGIEPAWLDYRARTAAPAIPTTPDGPTTPTTPTTPAEADVRVYDASPTGALPGEGCGIIALMRTADAHATGLPVYAEIAGWHVTGDDAQAAIRGAYQLAGIDPADVQLIEGHGAATARDDHAELTALLAVFAGPCALGSVRSNIGDTRGAAGVAAVLKAALAMAAGIIPPTTGCAEPHQLLRAGPTPTPLRLVAAAEPWPETAVRLAAVNSLGSADLAGSSHTGPVHMVLRREQEPGRPAGRRRRAPAADTSQPTHPHPAQVTQATQTTHETREVTQQAVIAVRGTDRDDLAVTLDTIAITASRLSEADFREFARGLAATESRASFRTRAAIVAGDAGTLAERARKAAEALRSAGPGPLRVWPHDQEQHQEQPAQSAGPGVYLSEHARGQVVLLFPGLATTQVEHSAILSTSMATLDDAQRLGIRPAVAVGYSFGEIVALAWAGTISFGDAARFAAHRAEIIRAMPARTAMARVLAGPAEVTRLCAGTAVALAAQEGPGQHVVAGPAVAIREFAQRVSALGIDVEVLNATRALHSPAMRTSVPPMRAAADALRFDAPRRRLISTVTGLDLTASGDIADLVADQLARPALLAGALALARADADLILLTARDDALGRAASAYGRIPVIQPPIGPHPDARVPALAAFFTAGAIHNLDPFPLTNSGACVPDTIVR
jgi:enediyne polyketide synthase